MNRLSFFSQVVLITLWVSSLPTVFATSKESEQEKTAYRLLNRIRSDAAMTLLRKNVSLEKAAKNHANYLARNRIISHTQKVHRPNFTGKTPVDRALHSGYQSKHVFENFSSGNHSTHESLSGLMSAIYHRLTFLDFSINEVGVGIKQKGSLSHFVYKMGNSELNYFCKHATYQQTGAYYLGACKHMERVSVEQFNKEKEKALKKNPTFVLWPSDGAKEIPPVFYEEFPDPLPDYSVSGYPISIQLNPHYFRTVKLLEFHLINVNKNIEIHPIRTLDKRSDPNQRLTNLQFAFFPLQRLDHGTTYQASVTLKGNGVTLKKSWRFQTIDLKIPVLSIKGRKELLVLQGGKEYGIYLPPQKHLPVIEKLYWKATNRMQIKVDWEDRNTVRISLEGPSCAHADFFMNGGRQFTVQLSGENHPDKPLILRKKKIDRCK